MERSDQNVQNNKNIVWQQMTITRKKRAESLQQVPKTIWLTGLSGAGKSTLKWIKDCLHNGKKQWY